MGLVTAILGLPLAPIRGVIGLAEILRDQAERELYDPARIRQRLEEAEDAAARGEISEEEKQRIQEETLSPLVAGPETTAAVGDEPEEGK